MLEFLKTNLDSVVVSAVISALSAVILFMLGRPERKADITKKLQESHSLAVDDLTQLRSEMAEMEKRLRGELNSAYEQIDKLAADNRSLRKLVDEQADEINALRESSDEKSLVIAEQAVTITRMEQEIELLKAKRRGKSAS